MNSRELTLTRIRQALGDRPHNGAGHEPAVARDYAHEHGNRTHEETVDLLVETLQDYRAVVHRTTNARVPEPPGPPSQTAGIIQGCRPGRTAR